MNKITLASLAVSALLGHALLAQNLIQNGSFEAPVIADNTLQRIAPTSWISGSTPCCIINGNGGQPGILPLPQHGQQYGDVGNEPTFTLSQSFKIANQAVYVLRWFDSAGHDGGLVTSPYSVSIITGAVQTVATKTFDAYHAEFGIWQARAMSLMLHPGTYTLRFTAEGVFNGLDTLLDDVSLLRLPDDDLVATIRCSAVDVCWMGRTEQMYQIQYSTDVAPTDWMDLGSPVAGAGINCVRDFILDTERRFYRVTRVP